MAPESKSGWTNPETQRKLLLSMLAISTEPNTSFSTDKIAKAMANMGEAYTAKAISHQLPKIRVDLSKIRAGEPVAELGTPSTTTSNTPATPRKRKTKDDGDGGVAADESGADEGPVAKKKQTPKAKGKGEKKGGGVASPAKRASGNKKGKKEKEVKNMEEEDDDSNTAAAVDAEERPAARDSEDGDSV